MSKKPRKTRAEKIEELLEAIIETCNDPGSIHTDRVERKIIAAEKYLNTHRRPQ